MKWFGRRHRVSFERRGLDANGDRLGDWEEAFKLTVLVRPRLGGEEVMQARLQGVQPIEMAVRTSPQTRQIDEAWRVNWSGKPYYIRAVAPDDSRGLIIFMADAGKPSA